MSTTKEELTGPATDPVLRVAEDWLRDTADGLWSAPKFGDRYAPVIQAEYRRMQVELLAAHDHLTELRGRHTRVLAVVESAPRLVRSWLSRWHGQLVEELHR